MAEGLQSQPAAQPATAGETLRKDVYALLVEASTALATLPADGAAAPEFVAVERAARAGSAGARAIIEVAGGAAVASALMQASALFRSTGHFRQSDVLERLAFVTAGWERRAKPRRK